MREMGNGEWGMPHAASNGKNLRLKLSQLYIWVTFTPPVLPTMEYEAISCVGTSWDGRSLSHTIKPEETKIGVGVIKEHLTG